MIVRSYTQTVLRLERRMLYRYMGCRGETVSPELQGLVERIASEAEKVSACRVCYTSLPVTVGGEEIAFEGWQTIRSASLARNLSGCREAYLFCATVGTGIDRKISASRLQPASAVAWDAAGTTAIEQLCDDFCASLPQPQRPRFSPGYGDLPLMLQRDLLSLLDAGRRVGVGLTQSLLMTPTKSVTAIVGVVEG